VPFQWIDNRVFVDVMIQGRGPFHFILDTGADAAVSDTTARALGLVIKNTGDQDEGVGESRVQTGQATLAELAIGPVVLRDVGVEVLPLGDSTQVFGAAPVDGIIGLPIFAKFVVKHDFVHHTLTFTPPGATPPPGIVVPFDLPAQIPVIDAELDGVAGRFGVDTGARSALLLYRPFAESHQLAEKYGAHFEGVTGWGVGGPVRSLLARAHELRIGPLQLHEPVVRISLQKAGATTSSAMAGLIGPDVLAQFDVTFDYPHHRMVLDRNPNYGRPDSYDRAGMWMGQDAQVFPPST
jgi:hypothetical protein